MVLFSDCQIHITFPIVDPLKNIQYKDDRDCLRIRSRITVVAYFHRARGSVVDGRRNTARHSCRRT